VSHKQTPESFWKRVKKSRKCWEWQGACNNTGYGTVAWHGKNYTAHRIAAWLSGLVESPAKPINAQEKSHVLHKCDNRMCCNPNHFFIGSYSDNQLDAYAKKRKAQPKGEKHTNAKLTDKQAVEIRHNYKTYGLHQQKLADRYNVSQSTISKIIRGETY
jgi:DNA-binding transcriptional regulator YiaG